MATYTVTIPNWHPTRVNQWDGKHWGVRSRAKASDRGRVFFYLLNNLVQPHCRQPRRVTLTIVLGPRQRGGDPDAYWKSLLDALVYAGYLKDDSKEWVELMPVQYERGPEKATIITLEDLPCRNASTPQPKRKRTSTKPAKGTGTPRAA